MGKLVTTLGVLDLQGIEGMLPHEHVFTDLRRWNEPGYAQAEAVDVIRQMKPQLEGAKACGISVIAEATPVGVGRRADILKKVSEAMDFPLLVPTGVYREPWIPEWVHEASEEALFRWMTDELTRSIGDSGVQAGWIKLSAGDNGMTACERKVLKAAARAAKETGAVIGSHTVKGSVVREQLDILEEQGCKVDRFIWIHAHADPDRMLHKEIAGRGAWIEYDAIGGSPDDSAFVGYIQEMVQAGFEDQLLISQDRGWYNPAVAGGGEPMPFTHIMEKFLPELRQVEVGEAVIRKLICMNPFKAFAR